jgi:hypothetical protein
MTLDEVLLQRLAEWRPHSARQVLDVADPAGGWKVSLTADHADVVGCQLWEVRIDRTKGPLENPPALADRAATVASRVTGLLEPLRLLEVTGDTAQLRSSAPLGRGDELFYYEVTLSADGAACLRRYQSSRQPGARRQSVAFSLTNEALAKLVADLIAA